MRYLLLFVLVAACQLASAQTANTSLTRSNLLEYRGYLDGEFEIRSASARPAARAYYLIYAAACERYAEENKEVLASHPPLARLLAEAQSRYLLIFDGYSERMGREFSPIADRKRELGDLERFVASGYAGVLKTKLLAYIEELKK